MLHGYGPAILNAVPRDRFATSREIREAVQRTPPMATVYKHLGELVAMGCIAKEGHGYRRLVDSELDLPVEAAA